MTPQNLSVIMFLALKVFALFGLLLYCIFAGIMVRQEQLISHMLEDAFEPVLRFAVYIHLAASLGLLFFGFFLL